LLVRLAKQIAQRELKVVQTELNRAESELSIQTDDRAMSPGNVLSLEVERAHIT